MRKRWKHTERLGMIFKRSAGKRMDAPGPLGPGAMNNYGLA